MKLIRLSIIWFLISLFFATLFQPEHYNSFIYTISELAHQDYERAWILLLGFFGNGILLFSSGFYYLKANLIPKTPAKLLMVSGIAIIGMGLFQTNFDYYGIRPSDNILFMLLHIVFALSNQATFYLMVLYHIKQSDDALKKKHLLLLVLNVIFAVLFSLFSFIPFYRGIFQRLIFIVSAIWFWFYFNRYQVIKKD